MLLLGVSLVCLLGTMSAALPALFPTPVRYGALAIGYNLAASLFGGTAPLVMDALVKATGNTMMPAYYTVLFAACGVVAVLLMDETAQKPLAGSPPAVSTDEEARELVENQERIHLSMGELSMGEPAGEPRSDLPGSGRPHSQPPVPLLMPWRWMRRLPRSAPPERPEQPPPPGHAGPPTRTRWRGPRRKRRAP
jgi:hypothetical protein